MFYKRSDHSMCFLNDRYLIITGSYLREKKVCETVERYDIKKNFFEKMPPLKSGRCQHSSCSFDGQYVFVMCGIILVTTEIKEFSEEDNMTIIRERTVWTLTNTIERFDTSKKTNEWIMFDIPNSPVIPRRTPGVVQINANEILIFGGKAQGK